MFSRYDKHTESAPLSIFFTLIFNSAEIKIISDSYERQSEKDAKNNLISDGEINYR
jgi:hypothetical protein|tara:strand:+ start:2758 stop:2925 length:168 start_codon:yes stop_codon:yes gene_type:complete